MGTITVYSPHSGTEVKIRPKDVGRAVKDKDGKMLYVLQRPDGKGFYCAMTRAGGQRDIDKYDHMIARLRKTKSASRKQSQQTLTNDPGRQQKRERQRRKGYAGPRSGGGGGLITTLIFLALLAGAAYWLFTSGPLKNIIGGN
ncbi:MAG: hypothetical protein R3236_07395 [Phycisphaeraceae bacterium]|nr:hypothetical protein [Phycisphaeraceae bacterium]